MRQELASDYRVPHIYEKFRQRYAAKRHEKAWGCRNKKYPYDG